MEMDGNSGQQPTQAGQPEQETIIQKAKGKLPLVFEFLKIIVLALVIVAPIRYFVFQPFIVKGASMEPNFHSGDYLIIDELSYRFGAPARGDVVVFDYPNDETQQFIKRVIGLPGETVTVTNGTVAVTAGDDRLVLEEAYLPDDFFTQGNVKVTLGEGEYFVMGDNREHSYDSRMWGAVPKSNIIGRSFIRLFPITSLGTTPSPTY